MKFPAENRFLVSAFCFQSEFFRHFSVIVYWKLLVLLFGSSSSSSALSKRDSFTTPLSLHTHGHCRSPLSCLLARHNFALFGDEPPNTRICYCPHHWTWESHSHCEPLRMYWPAHTTEHHTLQLLEYLLISPLFIHHSTRKITKPKLG